MALPSGLALLVKTLVEDVALQLVVEAVVCWLEPVPCFGPRVFDRQIEAPEEVTDVSAEACLEPVDAVVGVVFVAVLGFGDAYHVVVPDATLFGPAHDLPLQEVIGIVAAL